MHRFLLRELIVNRENRTRQRLSMREIAEATKIAPQTLSKIADPQGYVTNTRYLEALCRFFEVTPNEVLAFDPPIGSRPSESGATDGLDREDAAD